MPLYESRQNAANRIKVKKEWKDAIVIGPDKVSRKIIELIQQQVRKQRRTVILAFDGWYGVDWKKMLASLRKAADRAHIKLGFRHINQAFKPMAAINKYKQVNITDDPGFGLVNTKGVIQDLMDRQKLTGLKNELKQVRRDRASELSALIVYGPGSAVKELNDLLDLKFYFDMTRQEVLWQMWDSKLIPFATENPKKDYGWKEYYYCDYYLLDRQKEYVFDQMHFYVEAVKFKEMKLIPRRAYDGIMSTAVKYPIKEVKIFQPGPWGAYRYQHLWKIPGLGCNAWNELAGPELSMLLDVGREKMLNMPTMNLMQYANKFLGPYLTKKYPNLFPMDVWLDDGYFPKPKPAERISMPIHNHPSTGYVKRHFKEPIGRYETYYIAEAYEGANTWMGYKENVDLEEWEEKCRQSKKTGGKVADWKKYIANWPSNVGDLYLIPPGTTHGHGGNQMILEMDTCPSIAATEYSFFLYDFVRPSWDDKKKTMTGKPVKLHLDHGFDTEQWRRADWVNENMRAKPKVVKWTKEYWMDQYSSYGPMPFHIERFHFYKRADNNTQGKFMNIVTLTVGDRVKIRSKKNPELVCEIELFQSALVPACFGDYEFVNIKKGFCTIVQLRWKKG